MYKALQQFLLGETVKQTLVFAPSVWDNAQDKKDVARQSKTILYELVCVHNMKLH